MYYHEVSVSFNWWMVLMVINCVVMFIVGARQYMLKNLKLKRRYSEGVFGLVATGLALLTGIVFIRESFLGYLQIIANHLGPDDAPDYALGIAVITLPVIFIVYGLILHFISDCAVIWKREKLREERNRILRKRHRLERKMRRDNDDFDPWVD